VPVLAPTSTATAQTRAVDDNELLSNQISKVVGQDSPLLQRAQSKALDVANGRGLLNSSMAAGAATAAVLDAATPIAQGNATAIQNVNNQNLANQQQTETFNAGQKQNAAIVNASESNKILAQMMDQQNRMQLADVEAQYKTLMQSQASASTIYQQSVKNISEILMNPDLTPEARSAAVANQNKLLKSGMQIIGAMGALNLDDLLTFPTA